MTTSVDDLKAHALKVRDSLLAHEAAPTPRTAIRHHNLLNAGAALLADFHGCDIGDFGGVVHIDGGTDKPGDPPPGGG